MTPEALEQKRAYMKAWRLKNRSKLNEYHKKWRKKNPDKVKQNLIKYWERRALNDG